MKIILCLALALFLSGCASNQQADGKAEKYGEIISYSKDKEIKYPDFSIKFLGERKEDKPPISMTFYDFEIVKGETRKKIFWTSGTGDIGPTAFELTGTEYLLELGVSDIHRALSENKLVIWTRAGYEEALKQKKK